jgi:hypothetical protein
MPRPRGRVRCPRADLQPAPGRHWVSAPRHYGPGRVLHAGLRDRQGRVTPAYQRRPRPRKHGLRLRPLRRQTPWGENRGGTPIDVLPPPIPSPASGGGCGWGQRPHPQGAAELDLASVGVSPPNFSFRSRSSCPGLTRASMPKLRWHCASTGVLCTSPQHGPPAQASKGRRSANGYVRW